MRQAESLCTLVHHFRKARKAAADVDSCDVCSLTGRLQHHCADKVVVADCLARLYVGSWRALFKKLVVSLAACAGGVAFERLNVLIFFHNQQAGHHHIHHSDGQLLFGVELIDAVACFDVDNADGF